MTARYLGKWDKSPHGDSPTVWFNAETDEFYVQGYEVDARIVQDELLPTAGKTEVPPGELLIRIPADMAAYFREELRGADAG